MTHLLRLQLNPKGTLDSKIDGLISRIPDAAADPNKFLELTDLLDD